MDLDAFLIARKSETLEGSTEIQPWAMPTGAKENSSSTAPVFRTRSSTADSVPGSTAISVSSSHTLAPMARHPNGDACGHSGEDVVGFQQ